VRLLTHDDWAAMGRQDPYWLGRWAYLEPALEAVEALRPARVLEIGAYGLPLVPGGDTLDAEPRTAPTWVWDARQTPWPCPADYDLVIALQVWEHLAPRQREAAAEALRVAPAALVSIPYRWAEPADHAGLGEEHLREWFGREPERQEIVCGRLLALFRR